jgi:hypothetical protein
MRRLCFDQGAGYRASPLRADVRQVICDRITELGKKTWPCFKTPTAEQSAQVGNTTKLEKLLIDLEEGTRVSVQPSRIVDALSNSEAQGHTRPHNPRDSNGASASCVGDVQGASVSRSATVLFDTTEAFVSAARAGNEAANGDADADGASASWVSAPLQGAGASPSASILSDLSGAFGPTTRAGGSDAAGGDDDDDDDDGDNTYGADLREQPGDDDGDGDSIDSGILDALRNDKEVMIMCKFTNVENVYHIYLP